MAIDPGVLEIHPGRAVFEDNQLQLIVPPVGASTDLHRMKAEARRVGGGVRVSYIWRWRSKVGWEREMEGKRTENARSGLGRLVAVACWRKGKRESEVRKTKTKPARSPVIPSHEQRQREGRRVSKRSRRVLLKKALRIDARAMRERMSN